MADPRTFTLIGEFQDGITPELVKINDAINTFKRNMMTMTSRRGGGFSDITQSVGKLVSAQNHLKTAIEEVGAAAKSATDDLKGYNQQVGKVARAHYHIAKSGELAGNKIAKDWEGAGKSLDGYARRITRLSTMGRKTRLRVPEMPYASAPRTPRTPRAMAAGGGGNGPRPPGGGGGGGGVRGGDGYNFHMGAFAFGMQLGQGISQPVTAAVLSGFQLGVGLLQQSFQYISGAFAERVKDEMSDLSAAGGYYSVAQRQKDPFVKTLQDAVDFTQETNAIMARLASSLPGETQDYVEVSKRVSDSIARLVSANEKGAIEYARQLRTGQEEIYRTSLEGPEARKGAMQVILGELTKKTVMAGFGGSSGVGGARGPHGLPGLTERMLTDPTITMGKLSRYAAVFGDPKISSALERYLPKLEAAGPDMLKRAKILNEMYDEVVPPEMIAAMRNSMAGMMEAFKSAFLNPEVGFLGIGRKLQEFAPKMNLYGQFIDKTGKVVEDASMAAKADIGIYEMFRDIIANFGSVLMPIVDNLSAMWDPMRAIGEALQEVRIFSSKFLTWFRNYNQGLKDYAKTLSKEDAEKILSTRNLRASLATINNLFRQMGIFSSAKFKDIGTQLMDPSKGIKELGQIASSLMKTFFESDASKKLGEFVGNLLGTIVVQISTMTGFFAKRLTGGKLGEGFGKAFEDSGGVAALKQIFNDLYKLVWEAFVFAVKALPLDLILKVGLATILVPAAISGIGMMIGQFMTELIGKVFGGVFSQKTMGEIVGSTSRFNVARQAYLLDKSSPKITGDVNPLRRTGAPSSLAGPAVPQQAYRNPLFPNVATPGGLKPGVTVGGSFRAPRVPKNPKAPKGMEWLMDWLAGNDDYPGAPKTKDLGKNLRVAGKDLAIGFSKNLEKTKGFFGNFYRKGGLGTRMGAGGLTGLKNPIGMLGPFGVALTALTGIINGIVTLFKGGSVWDALGATAGPIAGTIIGTAIAGPIGGIIGGYVGSLDGVTQTLGQIFGWVGQSLTTFGETLGELGSAILGLVQSITGAETETSALQQLMVSLKMAAFPLLATLDLINVVFKGLTIGVLEAVMWFDKTFQGGRREKELAKQYAEANASLNRLIRQNDEKYASWSRSQGTTATLGGKPVMWDGWKWVPVDQTAKKPITPTTPVSPGKPTATQTPRPGAKPGGASPAPSAPMAADPVVTQTAALNQKATAQITQAVAINKNTNVATVTLGNIRAGIMAVSNKLSQIQSTLSASYLLMASGNLKVKTDVPSFPGFPGGVPMGGAQGNLGAAQSIASQNGLSLTSFFRPGDKGMHGVGRAMDFSNGVNTPQQMAFAQQMISRYGSSLAELIYTPLGFGIKNGQKVPLSYWGEKTNAMHYNHVHVAFAEGKENGKMFSSQQAAGGWEKSMVPGSVKIASVTANSGDGGGFGALTIGDINLTVHAGEVSDPDQLASLVAMRIGDAVAQARASSVFV